MKAYFVTGTDTGVGKTTVAVALLAAATARGWRTRCLKPAESGCRRGADGALVPEDGRALWAATDRQQVRDEAVVYGFEEPVAPGVAAERSGTVISLERIEQRCQEIRAGEPDLFVVEGAGGLLVPMGQGRMVADLAQRLGLPLLVVARPGLGTINHTLLTIEAARSRGIQLAGVVFSASGGDVDASAAESNAAEIEKASAVPVLGCLPHVAGAAGDALARAAESTLRLDLLLPRS